MILTAIRTAIREHGWHTYIGLCLLLWGTLATGGDVFAPALAHWPMALVMIGGSLVAGSTPMGGGTIAFPALVLGFHESPAMARDFGLAIQSIGMTSALLFIVMRGIPVERRLLTWSCVGAVIGLTLGTYLLAARVPADWVKLLFATLWITFGGWLVTGTANAAGEPRPSTADANVVLFGLVVGIVGGAVASLIGVGVEMLVYATLVLRFGWGPKAAVPTAVCATALVSPVGMALRAITAGIHPAVFPTWMACVPIVIFGAPAGAYISTRMPRSVLLKIIGVLVVVQFLVTVNQVRPSLGQWAGVIALAAVSGAGLWLLAPRRDEEVEPAVRPTFDLMEQVAAARPPLPAPAIGVEPLPMQPLAVARPLPPPAIVDPTLPAALDFVRANEAAEPLNREGRIETMNLDHIYQLGMRLHPLGAAAEGVARRDWLLRQAQNVAFLESALESDESPLAALPGAREEAVHLLEAVSGVATRSDEAIRAAEAIAIQTAHREFERACRRELQKRGAFLVDRVGIYDTELLLNRADEMFGPPVAGKMSAAARAEWRAAGRCLALQLGTACACHTVRAVDQMIREYPDHKVDATLVELIDHVRAHRSNPISDSSQTVDLPAAAALFSVAFSAIATFAAAVGQATAAPRREWV